MTAASTTTGKVVVVTGATRGIGFGLAREFVARGCRVAICGRKPDAVETAVTRIAGTDRAERVIGVPADVTAYDDVQRLWDAAVTAFGRVDVWINNAGMSLRRVQLPELNPEELRAIVETNLLGAMWGTHVAINGMLAAGSGQVWNMEGFGSDGRTADGIAPYGATKRALTYFTGAVAKELKGKPVSINWLSPGIVATDLLVDDYAGDEAALEKAKKIFNILGDRVETVTPWLVEHVLATTGDGPSRVAWLTRRKAAARFATAALRKRDIFAGGIGATAGTP